MKRKYLMTGAAAALLGVAFSSCSHDFDTYEYFEEDAAINAEMALGFEIPETQDWNLVSDGTLEVTADAGIDAVEVLLLDAFPYGNPDAKALARADVSEGQTVTLTFEAPSYLQTAYVACRNAKNDYRVRRVAIDAGKVSFSEPATARTRAAVATPSVAAEGTLSFNAELAQAWVKLNAAEAETGYDQTAHGVMDNYSSWNNSGWNDKFYQINASVVPANISSADVADVMAALQTAIPEGENNLSKAQQTGYTITTEGGPVTMTPIHASSNSNDRISYYYYPKNQVPTADQIKTMKKYTIGQMGGSGLNQTYSLVYEDASGNVSYDFPKDYVICFIVTNTSSDGTYRILDKATTTTTTSGGGGTLSVTSHYSVKAGQTYRSGSQVWGNNLLVQYGLESYTVVEKTDEWGNHWTENEYVYFNETKASNDISGYEAFANGTGVNGDIKKPGSTVYYLRPWYYNASAGYLDVAVKLGSGKKFWVYDVGASDQPSTSGTVVEGFAGITKETNDANNKNYVGTIRVPVESGHWYGVYAAGSKLTFYGCEILTLSGGESTTTASTAYDYKNIPTAPEYYADGSLNTSIHSWGGSGWDYSANTSAPHNAVFSINGTTYLGFEDWNDFDYNDLVFAIEGATGGEVIEVPEEAEKNYIYTYAFEDNTLSGDYDMNDVVLQVQENQYDKTKLDVTLVAAGATYNIKVYLGDQVLFNDQEIHRAFGVDAGIMVNTAAGTSGTTANPVTYTLSKPDGFTFATANFRIHVLSLVGTPTEWVDVAKTGQYPCGILIPQKWQWPTEQTRVTDAYSKFSSWATDGTLQRDKDWYTTPTGSVVTR